MKKLYCNGFREAITKTGPNAGNKTLFFTVTFRFGQDFLTFTGWRLWQGKILPPATRISPIRMLNLGAISSNLAREVYFEFQKSLAESVEFRETHPLIEVCEDAIKHIVIKKEEIKKFSPELVK